MRLGLALLAFLALAGCGFQPMYGGFQGAALKGQLANIGIDPIPDRVGQILRQNLLEEMGGNGKASDYTLRVTLNTKAEGSGFRADEASTRTNLTLTAQYKLVRVSDDHVMFDDEAVVFAAYDVVESDFATLTARQDTERGLAEQAARLIGTRLAAYFRTEKQQAAANEAPAAGH